MTGLLDHLLTFWLFGCPFRIFLGFFLTILVPPLFYQQEQVEVSNNLNTGPPFWCRPFFSYRMMSSLYLCAFFRTHSLSSMWQWLFSRRSSGDTRATLVYSQSQWAVQCFGLSQAPDHWQRGQSPAASHCFSVVGWLDLLVNVVSLVFSGNQSRCYEI